MKKIKILVISSTFPRWQNDTEPSFVYELTKRLTKDFEIFVLCPYAKGSKKFEEIENMKIYRYKYLPFGMGTLAYDGGIMPKLGKSKFYYLQVPFFLLMQLLSIKKIIKKNNINVIHAHWLVPQSFIAVIYKRIFNKKIKILTTAHGADIFSLNHKIGILIKKLTFKYIDKLTVVSNAIKDEVNKFGYSKEIYVYPMGIDTNLFHPKMKENHIKEKYNIRGDFLLFVGRLAEKKGIKYLLEAMPDVLKEYPSTKLVIIGGGVLKDKLIKLSEHLKIDNSVIFAGPLPYKDLNAYFATADVFVGPSIVSKSGDREGFGLVFAEAMSCGTPVITTDLPAISDIVKDNETGFIVKQKNPREISEKIITLLINKDKLHELKIKARDYSVQHFDYEIIANKYMQLLNSL